jgi:O-antigen ligase
LQGKYTISKIGYHLTSVFQATYFVPILVLVFLERGAFGSTDISRSVSVFVKNHYGWASCIFLLCSADLLTNYHPGKWYRRITYIAIPIALLILFASGSRSAWVSTILTGGVMLFRWKNISAIAKIAIIFITSLTVSFFLADPDSAFYARWDKTQRQLDKGEAEAGRYQWALDVYRKFQAEPEQWLTGRGLFDYVGLEHAGGYHNSYFEILFGCGVFVFAYFLYLIVFRPGYFFFRYYSKYFLTFFPLLIIPFFESNLTGGQFLFYPWFSYMMFYSINPIKKQKEDRRRMKQDSKSQGRAEKTKLIPT